VGVAAVALTLRRDARAGRALASAAALYGAASLSPLGWRSTLVVAIPLVYFTAALARGGAGRASRWLAGGGLAVVLAAEYALPAVIARTGANVEQRTLDLHVPGLAYAVLALATFAAAALDARARGAAA
jgi:hypothetical protein